MKEVVLLGIHISARLVVLRGELRNEFKVVICDVLASALPHLLDSRVRLPLEFIDPVKLPIQVRHLHLLDFGLFRGIKLLASKGIDRGQFWLRVKRGRSIWKSIIRLPFWHYWSRSRIWDWLFFYFGFYERIFFDRVDFDLVLDFCQTAYRSSVPFLIRLCLFL